MEVGSPPPPFGIGRDAHGKCFNLRMPEQAPDNGSSSISAARRKKNGAALFADVGISLYALCVGFCTERATIQKKTP